MPRYVAPASEDAAGQGRYIDQAYTAKYEVETINAYRKQGYIFKWIVSDDLIAAGGAVHCTTMQIARSR